MFRLKCKKIGKIINMLSEDRSKWRVRGSWKLRGLGFENDETIGSPDKLWYEEEKILI